MLCCRPFQGGCRDGRWRSRKHCSRSSRLHSSETEITQQARTSKYGRLAYESGLGLPTQFFRWTRSEVRTRTARIFRGLLVRLHATNSCSPKRRRPSRKCRSRDSRYGARFSPNIPRTSKARKYLVTMGRKRSQLRQNGELALPASGRSSVKQTPRATGRFRLPTRHRRSSSTDGNEL